MKVLITGGKGLLGTSITPVLREHFECASYDIDEWDITSETAGKQMFDIHRPDVLLNLAAMTDVDGCEDNAVLAETANIKGPATLAALCEVYHARLIHISTDYVFDGKKCSPYREDDAPSPESVYGRTKLAGEVKIFQRDMAAAVIRTEWLYGHSGSSFIDKVTKIAKTEGRLKVVNDQCGSPTYAKDLAMPVVTIIRKNLTGIYHVSNSGSCTWYDLAKAVFSIRGMDVEIVPISSNELTRKARRPAYSVFDLAKLRRDTGIEMRNWMDALKDYLAEAPVNP